MSGQTSNTRCVRPTKKESLVFIKQAGHLEFVSLSIAGGRKLAKSGMFSLPDPFLSFYRVSSDGREPLLVHRTAPVRDSRDPSWPLFSLPLRWLQEGGRDVPLLIRCYNHNRNGTENETTSKCTRFVAVACVSSLATNLWFLTSSNLKNHSAQHVLKENICDGTEWVSCSEIICLHFPKGVTQQMKRNASFS